MLTPYFDFPQNARTSFDNWTESELKTSLQLKHILCFFCKFLGLTYKIPWKFATLYLYPNYLTWEKLSTFKPKSHPLEISFNSTQLFCSGFSSLPTVRSRSLISMIFPFWSNQMLCWVTEVLLYFTDPKGETWFVVTDWIAATRGQRFLFMGIS